MLFSLFLSKSYSEMGKGIFSTYFNQKIVDVTASGSSKQRINGTKQMTKPEYAIYPWDKKYDWCSNCGRTYEEHPYIIFSLNSRKIKFNSYLIRAGCCYESGCCCEEEYYGYCIDCCLYSWSLQISEDNETWTTVHQVSKDRDMRRCKEKTYTLEKEYSAKYVRLIQDEACPGYPPCIAINKMELFGNSIQFEENPDADFVSFHDDDEDVSIIGHISRNSHN